MTAQDTASVSASPSPVARMSRLQFWLCLAIAVAVFLFSVGPIWSHPWNINLLDTAIYISYLIIPVMVLACLAFNRALNWRGAFLDMLELVLLKYALTFGFALVLWATIPKPLMAKNFLLFPAASPKSATESAPTLPPPSVIPPEKTTSISGQVFAGPNQPAEQALVFIAQGLESYVFAPSSNPLVLENNGHGIQPSLSAAMSGQPIQAHSSDAHLHTFVAKDAGGGAARLNVPLIRSGSFTPVRFEGAGFVAEVRCSVHPDAEAPAFIGVFAHPFSAITGADGAFTFSGVPAKAVQVAVFHPALGRKTKDIELEAGRPVTLRLDLR